MQIVEIARIKVPNDRQRKKIEPGPVVELSEAIAGPVGLLHPPVCWQSPSGDIELLVGERRFRAIQRLFEAKRQFRHNGNLVPLGSIPISFLGEADEATRFEAELSENVHRVDLHWQDRAMALARLHDLLKVRDIRQTTTKTAELLVSERGSTPVVGQSTKPDPKPENVVKGIARNIVQASIVARNMHNPKVSGARNQTEAYNQVLKSEEDMIRAALAKKQLAEIDPSEVLVEMTHGDLLTILPTMEAGAVDLICADPPYGVGASGGGFRSRTIHHHDYKDTLDHARELTVAILTEGFRVCKSRANVFLFLDIRNWEWTTRVAANLGWSVFPRPGIWIKSAAEGLAPWGGTGFRIGTEFFMFATKGSRGLISAPMDTFLFPRVAKDEREHAAEKPSGLLEKLILCSTLPGDTVLDPCCGSGSALVAAQKLKRRGIGIEKDEEYYNLALKNVHGQLEEVEDDGTSQMAE